MFTHIIIGAVCLVAGICIGEIVTKRAYLIPPFDGFNRVFRRFANGE